MIQTDFAASEDSDVFAVCTMGIGYDWALFRLLDFPGYSKSSLGTKMNGGAQAHLASL